MRRAKRTLFTEHENRIICDLVKHIGENWDVIANKLPGRTPKQIHDRYINYLRQGLQNGPWTNEEDEILMKMYKVIGPKWSKMMQHLPGRSGNNIKNRWHKHLMKKYFQNEKQQIISGSSQSIDNHDSQESSDNLNSQRIPYDSELDNLLMNDYLKNSTESKFSIFDISSGVPKNSNNKIEMSLEDQIQYELQNFDFEKSFYVDFQQINNNKNINTFDYQHKNANNDQKPIKLIKKVDFNEQSKKDFCDSNKISNQNSTLFETDIEIQEYLEELSFQKFDFL